MLIRSLATTGGYAMLNKSILDNQIGRDGRLRLKVLAETSSVPSGTYRFLAYGIEWNSGRFVMEHRGKPYLFCLDSFELEDLQIRRRPHADFTSFVVNTAVDGAITMTMHDSRDPGDHRKPIDISRRLFSLERLGRKAYGTRAINDKDTSAIVAISSSKNAPFIVLQHVNKDSLAYVILLVPESFLETDEWILAQTRPNECLVRFLIGRHLCIPTISRNRR